MKMQRLSNDIENRLEMIGHMLDCTTDPAQRTALVKEFAEIVIGHLPDCPTDPAQRMARVKEFAEIVNELMPKMNNEKAWLACN